MPEPEDQQGWDRRPPIKAIKPQRPQGVRHHKGRERVHQEGHRRRRRQAEVEEAEIPLTALTVEKNGAGETVVAVGTEMTLLTTPTTAPAGLAPPQTVKRTTAAGGVIVADADVGPADPAADPFGT